jgi:hypothetical protein
LGYNEFLLQAGIIIKLQAMSEKELNQMSKQLDSFGKKVTKSKASSRKFLKEMGVITGTGKLAKRYQGLCIQQGRG